MFMFIIVKYKVTFGVFFNAPTSAQPNLRWIGIKLFIIRNISYISDCFSEVNSFLFFQWKLFSWIKSIYVKCQVNNNNNIYEEK